MHCKWLKEEEALALIEGIPDVLSAAAKAKQEYFRKMKCVSCGRKTVFSEVSVDDLKNMRQDEAIPYGHARCTTCGCLFDPDTKLIVERGNMAKALEPVVHLINPRPSGSG